MSTHTPGAWYVYGTTQEQERDLSEGVPLLICTKAEQDDESTDIASVHTSTHDAEFIVRACNNYEGLLEALLGMNCMGGDERGGYCICPCNDGSEPDSEHSTNCVMARKAIANATTTERPLLAVGERVAKG